MTRKIDEMTHEEIVALTKEDLERLVKIGMAEEGIPIVDEPERTKNHSLPKEDMQVFTAHCIGQLGFLNRDECLAVLEAISAATSRVRFEHDYALGCNKVYPGFSTEYSDGAGHADLSTVSGRSLSQLKYVRAELEDQKKAEKAYTESVAAYRKATMAATTIRDEIYGVYYAHIGIKNRKAALQRKYEQYMELADGNAEIAMRFLAKVETLSEDERAMLIGEPNAEYVTEEC
jgi:hypothetical protein